LRAAAIRWSSENSTAADRLSTANEARKAQSERAKVLAERLERAERRKEREAIVAARNTRIDERKAAEAARKEREAAARPSRSTGTNVISCSAPPRGNLAENWMFPVAL
jgi:hypothetical protein